MINIQIFLFFPKENTHEKVVVCVVKIFLMDIQDHSIYYDFLLPKISSNFLYNSSPLKFEAMILPEGSIR